MLRKLISVAAVIAAALFIAAASAKKGATMTTKPSDAELKKKLTPIQYEVTPRAICAYVSSAGSCALCARCRSRSASS